MTDWKKKHVADVQELLQAAAEAGKSDRSDSEEGSYAGPRKRQRVDAAVGVKGHVRMYNCIKEGGPEEAAALLLGIPIEEIPRRIVEEERYFEQIWWAKQTR